MKVKGLIFIAILCLLQNVNAQNQNLPKERIDIHLSEQFVFSGDELWLSVYVSNKNDFPKKELSNLAFVEFVSSQNQSLVRKKVLLKNGFGACSISVPDSISTNVCYVLAYTNWAKNFGEQSFAKSKVFVCNPAKINKPNGEKKVEDVELSSAQEKASLQVRLNRKEFESREKVELSFSQNSSDKIVAYSVSASAKPTNQLINIISSQEIVLQENQPEKIVHLPDYKGILLNGTLINRLNNEPMINEEIVLSIPGKKVNIDFAKTDEKGRFNFLMKAEEGEKDIVFNLPTNDAVVRFNESFVNGFDNVPEINKIEFDGSSSDFVKRMFVFRQLQAKFKQSNVGEVGDQTETPQDNFYGEVYQTVYLKNFEKLDSISEYFYELTPTVHFPRKQGEKKLYLTNPKTNFSLGENPAVFIDGVYYPDVNSLAALDHNLVEQINVIPKNYYYRDKVFNGIVSIFTHNKNFNEVIQPESMSRLIYPLTDSFREFVASDPEDNSRIPDLRRLLHWESNAIEYGKEATELSFYTSDIAGEFEILVSALTESGEILKGKTIIEVRQ